MNDRGEKHSVLLVDDEPEVLFSLKGLLRREFELYTAQSGDEALRIMQQHPVHVVMTDQRMPEMTGADLLKKVRAEFPDAVRIVFTGYADIKAVIDAINSGRLFRYVVKPWDPDELVQILHEAAAEHDRRARHWQLFEEMHRFLADASPVLGQQSPDEASLRLLQQADALRRRIESEMNSHQSN